jgi:branched-chain amino acid transport system ATP-binding protein
VLEVKNLSVAYGPIVAVREVSLSVAPRSITAVLGANGAGKSSLLKAICGFVKPSEGTVIHDGKVIDSLSPHARARDGLVLVFEERRLFGGMTVLENLEMGGTRSKAAELRRDLDEVFTLFPKLRERTSQLGSTLSGGEQQMLAVGRALMTRPRTLLLDEPSMGLAPVIVDVLLSKLQTIVADLGVTIVLVEQNVSVALDVSSHAYVMRGGRVVMSKPAEELRSDEAVVRAYLT